MSRILFAALLPLASGICSVPKDGIFQDMHDGDMKRGSLSKDGSETIYTIVPYNNTQTWTIRSKFDEVHCNCSINFHVPGKPNPPPVPLSMAFYEGGSGEGQPLLYSAVFTDPSGTIAPPLRPVNAWILIDGR